MVMHQTSLQVIEDTGSFHGQPASLGMNAVSGQSGCAGHVQPVELAGHAQAGFISIDHLGLAELGGDGLIDGFHLAG